MFSATFQIPKLDEQIARLAGFEEELGRRAQQGAQIGIGLAAIGWRDVAAFKTGLYRGSIATRTAPVTGGFQGIAETHVRSARGFPYPRALEESTRYHYRSTARRGQQTAGQVAQMFKNLRPKLKQIAKAISEAMVRWAKV